MANHCSKQWLGLGSCSALAGIYTIPDILTYRKRLAKIARFFCYVTQEVIVTDKDKRTAQKEIMDDVLAKLRALHENPPPYSLPELLNLIWAVEYKSPEAGDAIALLIQRHFQKRRVLWQPGERGRLEAFWKLEKFPDEWGEEQPRNYERDVAPLALIESIEASDDYPVLNVGTLIKKDMRNRIVKEGAQGRNIDSKEVEREYRLKEFGDPDNPHEILPNLSKWNEKEKFFVRSDKYRNRDYLMQYTTEASPAWRADPWDPREVEGLSDKDQQLWGLLTKVIQPRDELEEALIYNLAGLVTMVQLAKDLGIPEGTLRSRKSRLITRWRKDATKMLSSSDLYMRENIAPKKQGKRPPNIGPEEAKQK